MGCCRATSRPPGGRSAHDRVACEIYGQRPVPAEVLSSIVGRLNEGWGKVATFSARGGKVDIEIKK